MPNDTIHIINTHNSSYDVKKLKNDGIWVLTSSLIQEIMPNPDSIFIANSENSLLKCLNLNTNYHVVTNNKLFQKYIFFEKLYTFSQFTSSLGGVFNELDLSEQILALLFGLWTEKSIVYLFEFDIEDLTERAIVLSILESHPNQKIYYVKKPGFNKYLFGKLSNVKVIDYEDYENINN